MALCPYLWHLLWWQPACLPTSGTTDPAHLTSQRHEAVSCCLQAHRVGRSHSNDLLPLWLAQTFPRSWLCCGPFRLSSWPSTPVLSQWPNLQSPSLNTRPPLTTAGPANKCQTGRVTVSTEVWARFTTSFPRTCLQAPSEVLKLTPIPSHRGIC